MHDERGRLAISHHRKERASRRCFYEAKRERTHTHRNQRDIKAAFHCNGLWRFKCTSRASATINIAWIRCQRFDIISIQGITAESDLFVRRSVTAVYNDDYIALKANGSRVTSYLLPRPHVETTLTLT